jgi:hypothetical protein
MRTHLSAESPVILALKWFFGFVFVTGVLVRIFGTDYHVTRIGDLLMEVGALGRLLLYLRGKSPASYLKRHDESALLKLDVAPLSLTPTIREGVRPSSGWFPQSRFLQARTDRK